MVVAGGVQSAATRFPYAGTSRLVRRLAGVTLLSSLAGLVWGSHLAAQELQLRLETKAEASLNRPVKWGRLRGISVNGIRFGKTTIPPIDANASSLEVEAIDIAFNWYSLLRRQSPKASITLVRPALTLVQNSRGEWPTAPLSFAANEAFSGASSRQAIERLRVQAGRITMTPWPQAAHGVGERRPVSVEDIEVEANFLSAETEPQAEFTLSSRVAAGGIKVRGKADLTDQSVEAKIQAYNLPTTGLNLALPPTVAMESGILNSNLMLAASLTDNAQLDWNTLEIQGSAIFKAGQVLLGQLPEPISHLRSSLWFQGKQVTLHNTGLHIGDFALSTEGTVSLTEGYNLLVQIPAIRAKDIQKIATPDLPADPNQIFQWQTRVTGPLQEPQVEARVPPHLGALSPVALTPKDIAVSLGIGMLNLPMRDRLSLIEGASYEFRSDGAWFVLTDGTVIPPISPAAYQQAAAQLNSAMGAALDRKFFWLLQSSPYVTAIAADLGRGNLREYLNGSTLDTDRFFLEYFLPIYQETSSAAGLDPGESLWMLDHSLRTLQDPLLRRPDATPITSGSGMVGSFWQDEQLLSMQQLILRPQLAQAGNLGDLARLAVLKYIDRSTSLASRRLSSTPEVMSKLPNVTFGAEEGALALALGMNQLQGADIYSTTVRALADEISQNEADKQLLRTAMTEQLQRLSAEQTRDLGTTLANFSPSDWGGLGLGATLGAREAAYLNGTNTLSVLVSRSEKAGYSLVQSYRNSLALLVELLQDQDHLPAQQQLIFALLKDQTFNPRFWQILSQRLPHLAPRFEALLADALQYRQIAQQGATLHEQFYAALVEDGQDISVSATIKHAVGFQAHLAMLMDQAFNPADPTDPRYLAFRRSLAIYLREAPDISVYGGTLAALRLYGYETLNVQEMLAVDVSSAPRILALVDLYNEAWQRGMIDQWDVPGFQRILLVGAMLAAGVERLELPPHLAEVGFPSAQFRRNLLFVVGPEGIKLEATRLGVQAHDHRVSFQPVAIPDYRAPSFDVTDASACPSRPAIQAIALGPATEFVWYPTMQQVVLQRGERQCPLHETWSSLYFDTLLESVPVVHSPAGAVDLQAKLRQAQLLEAGIF